MVMDVVVRWSNMCSCQVRSGQDIMELWRPFFVLNKNLIPVSDISASEIDEMQHIQLPASTSCFIGHLESVTMNTVVV